MPLIKGIFFVISFISTQQIYAQFFDTIKVAFNEKPSIDLRYDSRTSFITTHPARISGIKVGLVFNNKVKVGVGYNWLTSTLSKTQNKIDILGNSTSVIYKLKLQYISPYFEYTYYNSNKFELSIPILLGIGTTYYTPIDKSLNYNKINSSFLFMYEPYSVAIYKLSPWLGIGIGIGYRLVLIGNYAIDDNINSPVYIIKVKLYASEILKKV